MDKNYKGILSCLVSKNPLPLYHICVTLWLFYQRKTHKDFKIEVECVSNRTLEERWHWFNLKIIINYSITYWFVNLVTVLVNTWM